MPGNWTADRPHPDYGVDLRVDLYEGNAVTGLELLVQMKASARAAAAKFETLQLKVSTYNMLWDKLQVVMLVKYVQAENEAYWLLLRDVPKPNESHKTFTVRIPKANRLSATPWASIQAHVRKVTDFKLAAMRAQQLQQSIATSDCNQQ